MRHPGAQVRKECIAKNGLTVTKAARILHVDRQTLSNLLNGHSGMSPEMAVRLEKVFGTPAKDWMQRQLDYDYAQVMKRAAKITVEPFTPADEQQQGGRG
ncbi:HigA family addiction module antitoxin [Roseibaca sp. V10]|uniref:HigA family addiction module antitoxin n=1 Tax=Roseinatronobacter domitianus TaxID=2940293 RepID=A0ABT0M3R3_9RHOB|nr:HigA family addiction module antitoxin [Roseibaca domitiana]MCL1629502.1 HigA family addiction module antitoxin [Roseibaca domitiana]